MCSFRRWNSRASDDQTIGTSGGRDVAESPRPGVPARAEDVFGGRVRPAARGAQTAMRRVDVDDGFRDVDDIDVMRRRREVVSSMVRDRDLAGLVEIDADAMAGRVAELEAPDVGVAAVLLRTDVRDVLIRDGRLPDPDEARPLPVGVGLMRTGTQPPE